MENNDVLKQVNTIFKDVLDNNNIKINNKTTAIDIDEWDSLSHILLVVTIEKYFKIKFTSSEIMAWKNVGEMCMSIQKRL